VRIARSEFARRRHAGRRRRWRIVLAVVLVAALVAGAGWLVLASPYLLAEKTAVSGVTSVPATRVETVARVPVGTPLARVDLSAVRARVEAIPAVRRAEVTRSWPHSVRIAVTERVPVAVVDQGQGLRAVDDQGVLFGSYARRRPAGLPLITTPVDTGSDALAEGARVVASLAPEIARRVQTTDVASVDQVTLVLANGRKIVWGSAAQSGLKAEVVEAMLPSVAASVRQLDVSVPSRPTTR
jgi:cell division protein FtsQ